MPEQYFLFTMPDDSMCPVWVEMYGPDGHYVAPSPHGDFKTAAAALRSLHPAATIDELCYETDIEECREWARTMPLEPIPA